MSLAAWDQRIRRAEELSQTYPFSSEVMRFYARAAALQKGLYWYLKESSAAGVDSIAVKFPEFVSAVEPFAPQPIAESAREWKARGADSVSGLLQSRWQAVSDDCTPETLLARLFLQPYAEHCAQRAGAADGERSQSWLCPVCSQKPSVGVLRPEGDGGKRSLVCSMCSTEWAFGRIRCAGCGEDDVDKLAVFTAEQFNHVRIEICETCRCYIKTVDLTKDGRAVPVVDELATLPLNLWAQEHEYVKVRSNLLGM
jgi:FdhE protein